MILQIIACYTDCNCSCYIGQMFADEETGGYVSYQCVLPMLVHGSGYVQMQMISNSKAEKLVFTVSKRSMKE